MQIAMLVREPSAALEIRRALLEVPRGSGRPVLTPCSSWKELRARGLNESCVALLVDPLFESDGTGPASAVDDLQCLMVDGVGQKVILLLSHGADPRGYAGALGRHPCPIFLRPPEGLQGPAIFRALALVSVATCFRPHLDRIRDDRSEEAADLVFRAVVSWPRPRNVQDLADVFSCTGRSLRRRTGTLELPTPVSLLGWSKLLEAVSLALITGRSRGWVCAVVGIGGAASLSHLSNRLCGRPFRELLQWPQRVPECLVEAVLEGGLDQWRRGKPGTRADGAIPLARLTGTERRRRAAIHGSGAGIPRCSTARFLEEIGCPPPGPSSRIGVRPAFQDPKESRRPGRRMGRRSIGA